MFYVNRSNTTVNKEKLRELAIQWAQLLRTSNAVVVDTESCGGRKEDEIISIGVARVVDGKKLFYSLVRPSSKAKFNYYATKVHGIQEHHLVSAPTIEDVWKEVQSLLAENIVVAYNKSADERMIRQTAENWNLTLPDISWECAMKKYKEFSGKNVTLTKACEELNVKSGGHNALEDAIATARVIYRMANARN